VSDCESNIEGLDAFGLPFLGAQDELGQDNDTAGPDDTIVDPMIEMDKVSLPPNITIPESLTCLKNTLRNGYSPPPIPQSGAKLDTLLTDLSREEFISLEHFIAWSESNGTIKAYKQHAHVLGRATSLKIL
jgi:hypothetical protein